jgi:protein-S-isoprenylcysteine O-methyltransferase Ste14
MGPGFVIGGLWIAFWISWAAAASWSNSTIKRATMQEELKHRIPLIASFVLLAVPAHGYRGWMRLWQPDMPEAWIVVVLIAVGLGFAWWARLHLGRLWSATITRKEGHHVVDTGPYRLVRHPIYTGILFAVYATAAVKGTMLGIAGAVLATWSLWLKARLEERFLRAELGEPYVEYCKRTPMLLPFV